MKDALIILGVIFGCLLFLLGLISLLVIDSNNDQKDFEERCKHIASLSEVNEYKVNYSTCYLVKNGKIIEVK